MTSNIGIITQHPSILPTTSRLTQKNHWDHILARCAFNRMGHLVPPGLYALGSPNPDTNVFVTANYTLSFDALRQALDGLDAFILVLDTHGINVWCAAGKGTFGTDELVHRIEVTKLAEVVSHRRLILPQLGAPGVAAHDVKKRSGFKVEYGPVRADDIPEYLKTHQATPQMRQVRFTMADRLVLIPVEIINVLLPSLVAAVVVYFLAGLIPAMALAVAVFTGVVLFPILLPWLPTRYFSTKGLILGIVTALPVAIAAIPGLLDAPWWKWVLNLPPLLMVFPALAAFIALNFTGSSTYTSKSGVKQEMFRFIPLMAWLAGISLFLFLVSLVIRIIGA